MARRSTSTVSPCPPILVDVQLRYTPHPPPRMRLAVVRHLVISLQSTHLVTMSEARRIKHPTRQTRRSWRHPALVTIPTFLSQMKSRAKSRASPLGSVPSASSPYPRFPHDQARNHAPGPPRGPPQSTPRPLDLPPHETQNNPNRLHPAGIATVHSHTTPTVQAKLPTHTRSERRQAKQGTTPRHSTPLRSPIRSSNS